MNRCSRNGYLVSSNRNLWTDSTEFDVDGLPVIGCTRIRCERCQVRVRNVPGYAFRTPDDVSPAELTSLFNTPDPTTFPLLHPTRPEWRLYFCKCSRWLELSEHGCEEPDHDPTQDPSVPWACEGHPLITLPHELHGTQVSSATDLRGVVERALGGKYPPQARPADTAHGAWLIRLYLRLQTAERTVVLEEARAALDSPDPRTRARALAFFVEVADKPARDRLIEILEGDRRLYDDVPDEITANTVDKTLEHTIWRVLSPLVATSGPARAIARADALKGRGSLALYSALSWGDSGFVINNLEDLARAAPGHVADLTSSLTRLPAGSPVAELRAKISPPAAKRPPTLEDALRSPGNPLVAWDLKNPGAPILRVFDVGEFRANQLGAGEVPAAEQKAMQARLEQRGLRIGGTHGEGSYVWFVKGETLWIWSPEAIVAYASKGQLALGAGGETKLPTKDVTKVTTGPTGVALIAGSREIVVVPEAISSLGSALATWLGVPHGEDARGGAKRVIPKSLETALAQAGPLVGAWDNHNGNDRVLAIYRVGAGGAELLAKEELAADDREDMNERMRASGIRIGGTHRDKSFVWAMDDAGATIWTDAARVFDLPAAASRQIVKVVTFFGPKHRGQRGVRTERADGTSTVVVEEDDPTPSIDPTYGNDQMDADIEWAYYLGLDLATWLDVPHFDQLTGEITNAEVRVIADGTRTLAKLVMQAPAEGAFAPIEHAYGPILDASELVLRIAPLADDQRTVELRVTSKRSKAAVTRALKQGTNAQIARFLLQLRTPTTVLRTKTALLR